MFTYSKDQTDAAREATTTARTMYAQARSKEELVEILELLTGNRDAYEEYGKPNKLQLVDTLQVMAAEIIKVDNREKSAAYYMRRRDSAAEDNRRKLEEAKVSLEKWVADRLSGSAFEIMNGLEWVDSAYGIAGEIEARGALDALFYTEDEDGEPVRRDEDFETVVDAYLRKARNKAAWYSSSTSVGRNMFERETIKWFAKVAEEMSDLLGALNKRELFE